MKTMVIAAMVWMLASTGYAQVPSDAIDLAAVTIHGVDVRGWAATVPLPVVELSPGSGVTPQMDRGVMNARWPDVQVWNNPSNPLDGYIQWTLWACVPLSGTWHCGGMHEFWGNRKGPHRQSTGAHPLEFAPDNQSLDNWRGNWAYDGRWGEMASYVPRDGDEFIVFMTAGAIRPGTSNHQTVQERSNLVKCTLRLRSTCRASEMPAPPPPGPPPPSPPPPSPGDGGISTEQYAHLVALIQTLSKQMEASNAWQFQEAERARQSDTYLVARLETLAAQCRTPGSPGSTPDVGGLDKTKLMSLIGNGIFAVIEMIRLRQ